MTTTMTREDFSAALAFMTSAYNKKLEHHQLLPYYESLKDFDPEVLRLAVRRAVLEHEYPTLPTPAMLRRLATEIMAPPAVTYAEAWVMVRDAVRRFGIYRAQEGLDSLPPLARRAAAYVGWRALCDARESECDTLRSQFREAYNTDAQREQREQRLPLPVREQMAHLTAQIGALPAPVTGGVVDQRRQPGLPGVDGLSGQRSRVGR